MKIDAGASSILATQRTQAFTAENRMSPTGTAGSPANLAEGNTSGIRQADFTSMTRQELRDWTNNKIRNGEMSLDESAPFMAMTMKIPVQGGYGGELQTEFDTEKFDFTQKIRDGIDGAISRNDSETLKMLQSAMSIMNRFQGQTVGVDTRA